MAPLAAGTRLALERRMSLLHLLHRFVPRTFACGLLLSMILMGSWPAAAGSSPAWSSRMDALAVALTSLLRDTHGAAPEEGRENAALRFRHDVAALRAVTHQLSEPSLQKPDADPSIAWLLGELDRAAVELSHADRTRAADVAFAVAWTCMACHTRSDVGAPVPRAALAPVDASLPPDVRGTVLAATRRFSEARTAFRDAVFDESFADREPTRWERAVKGTLLLDLRVAADPVDALAVVDRVLSTPAAEPLWQDAVAWRRVLVRLVREKDWRPRTPEALEAEATDLIDRADALAPTDAGAEILYLRATAVVHELLQRHPHPTMRAQALAWLGKSYRALRDLDIWSLHLVYDAACVEAAPHSLLAEECYVRWLEGALSDFTGNGGGDLPPELIPQAARLRSLARR